MEYADIIDLLSDNGYEVWADALKGWLASEATKNLPRHAGDAVASLREVQKEFTHRVDLWSTTPHEDLDPLKLLEVGPLYAYGWAVAAIIHRIENPEEELDSDRTHVPDLFLLGLLKANQELSTKVLDTVASLEKAARANELLGDYEHMDKLLDELRVASFNEFATRKLSVMERVEQLGVMLREEQGARIDERDEWKQRYDEAIRLNRILTKENDAKAGG